MNINKILLVSLIVLSLCCSGCFYPGIHGKVVDNITGKPIEDALVVAQWTKKHGLGFTYHTQSKITETLSDKEGAFSLTGIYDPFVDPPEMIIYKEGYIPWRNDSIFPNLNKVKDYEWKNNVTYKLDAFAGKYTPRQLDPFLDSDIMGRGRDVPIFNDLMNKLPIY